MYRFFTIAAALALVAPAFARNPEIPPTSRPVKLFNGKNLKGFDTYLKSRGLNRDPDRVFQAHDGMIHISGVEYGYLITQREFSDYYLTFEFKWGEKTHPPRERNARDSGVLFHVVGPHQVWPRSIEYQVIEGGTGDIILVGGVTLTVKGQTRDKGRFDRFGKGPWKDEVNHRDPAGEVEKPRGEWNFCEYLADGDKIRYWVNGKLVNEGSGAALTRGRILFQSEGAEVFFRNVVLHPLKKRP